MLYINESLKQSFWYLSWSLRDLASRVTFYGFRQTLRSWIPFFSKLWGCPFWTDMINMEPRDTATGAGFRSHFNMVLEEAIKPVYANTFFEALSLILIWSLWNLETGQSWRARASETRDSGRGTAGCWCKLPFIFQHERGIKVCIHGFKLNFFLNTQISNKHYFSIGQSCRARASETRDRGRGTAGFHSHFCL